MKPSQLLSHLTRHGGFTYRPGKGYAKHGLAVAIYPEREAQYWRVSENALVKYQEAQRDIIRADPHAYLGAWKDEKTHITYLDVVHVTRTHKHAEQLSRQYDQLAYYDLTANITHYVKKGESK